uniref:Uncharacterized protein n=1 Tax=Acrobeloides nanus TaxID=290746 RepID=A0A914EI33_9BILA
MGPKKIREKEKPAVLSKTNKSVRIEKPQQIRLPHNSVTPMSDSTYIRMDSPSSEKSYGILKKTRLNTPSTEV